MTRIKRRTFLGSVGLGAAGSLPGTLVKPGAGHAQCSAQSAWRIVENKSPLDIKLNVKQVFFGRTFDDVWEGPCRAKRGEDISPSEQSAQLQKRFQRMLETNKECFGPEVNIMEPFYAEYPEQREFGEHDLKPLDADQGDVDLYLVGSNKHTQMPTCLIGQRYAKPAIHIPPIGDLRARDVIAFFRARGMRRNGFAPYSMEELSKLLPLFWARKVFRRTNVMYITNRGGRVGRPVMSNVFDFADLNKRHGVGVTIVTYDELSDEMERVRQTPEIIEEAEALTDELVRNATTCWIEKRNVLPSVQYYQAVKNLMERHHCNAHAVECFELCSSKLPDKWKMTTCLAHSLLKDEGYSSACEGDLNALLSMVMLMYASNRSAHMGNLVYTGENSLQMQHVVPGRKMMGFEQPDLPYALGYFVESKWGAKLEVDFNKVPEKTITIARVDPLVRKVLAIRAKIHDCTGLGVPGCSLRINCECPDTKSLHEKAVNYGFHFADVLGDYTQEIGQLAEMLDMAAEFHNA